MADSLAPLRCTACNAPLVLGDSDTVACEACGVLTPVPETYRELVRARSDDAKVRDEAEAAMRRLARPAPLVVKVLARMFDLDIFISFLLYGIPIGLFATLKAVSISDRYEARHHLDDKATAPTLILLFVSLGILLVFAFVPRALGIFANRRTADRAKLVAALAAHPPSTPGGTATCRGCGAPLVIAPNALVATCIYCNVQSALQVPAAIAALAKNQVATIDTTLHATVEQDRKEGRATVVKLATDLWRYTSNALLFAGVCILAMYSTAAGAIAGVGWFGFALFRASRVKDVDAESRRSINEVPGWVAIFGVVLVWGAFEYAPRMFGL